MFLAVDIGNTQIVLALTDNNFWKYIYRIESSLPHTTLVNSLTTWHEHYCTATQVTGIGISSVVPTLTPIVSTFFEKYTKVQPLIVSTTLDLGITISYDPPESLGVDRICSSVAAFSKYGGPLIVVDFGTATTYNCISSHGVFLGGAIAPGIHTAAASLASRTALLPNVNLVLPTSALNRNTIESIQAGVLYGTLDAFEGMIERLQREMTQYESAPPHIVLTGGFSEWVSHHTKRNHSLEQLLVLDGIYIIWKRNEKRNPAQRP
ncbi:MAG: type III pantothenate kinase [Bacteroidetes bacterium]|nr:type III pantothenate kinase [Bacteroidota bacterium]